MARFGRFAPDKSDDEAFILRFYSRSRSLLERKYILRQSDAEIARDLHIKPESVRMRLTRAKRQVAKLLRQHDLWE